MKAKKIPVRTCVITKERFPKAELIRIVKDNTGKVSVDPTGKANGHGAYLKLSLAVIKKARLGKQLDRHLETSVPDSIYDELEELLK